MEKTTRVWKSGEWVCLFVDDGANKATISLTKDEALALQTEISTRIAADGNGPQLRHVYYDAQKKPWSLEGFWRHPQHRPYHLNWTGNYAILQEYGNFKNLIQLVDVDKFDDEFSLAWEPLKVCRFCGFSRMKPCLTRQTCPNLSDYRLDPEEFIEDPDAFVKAEGRAS